MKTRQDSPTFRHGAFPALEKALMADVRTFRRDDPLGTGWFLVPTRNLRRRIRSRLAESGVSTFNLRFVLYPELAETILLRDAGPVVRRLPAGADRLVLEGVARRIFDRESHFFPLLEHGGFLTALGRSIGDLFHAGVSPDPFLSVARTGGDAAAVEIARIYAAVRGRYRELEMETVAQRIQRAAGAAGGLPPGPVRVYGFDDLNGVQRRMLRKLAETHPVMVYLPRSGEASVGSPPFRLWMESIGFEEAPDAPDTVRDENDAPDAAPVGNGAPGGAVPAPASTLRCFSAAGERREAEEVVRRVLGLLGAGVSPDRVAVLYRDAELYGDLFDRLFTRARIPVECAESRPLSRTRPARALRLLLQAARTNVSRRAVLDFLDAAAPMTPALPVEDATALVARWEAWTIDAGITRGRDIWMSRLGRLSRKPETDDSTVARDGAVRLDRDALALLVRLVPPLLDAMMELSRLKRWSSLAERCVDLGNEWLSEDPGWEAVRETVLDMGRLDLTGEPASLGLFETLLEERLKSIAAAQPAEEKARVFTGGVRSALGLSFDHIFIVGLTEKVFPRPARQDALLPDSLRSAVAGIEGSLPLRRDVPREEALLFDLSLSAAPDRTLSWSRIEPAEARPRLPSQFLLEALSRFRNETVEATDLDHAAERVPLDLLVPAGRLARETPGDPVPHDPARHVDAWNAVDAAEFDRLLVAAMSGAGALDRLPGLAAPELVRCVERHRLRWRTPSFTAVDGFLTSEPALRALEARIGTDSSWSASRLENYAGCPFRFFLEAILGVRKLERPEILDRIAPADKGSLIHAILRSFLSVHGKELRTDPRELHRALQAIALEEIARIETNTPVGYPLTWSVDADRIVDDLAAWLDFEIDRAGTLVPEAFELSFGGGRSARPGEIDARSIDAPVLLDLPGAGETRFQGRIDRVDLDSTGKRARVIDYKTGKKRDKATDVGLDGGLHLQLPIYLLALRAFFPEVARAGAEYLYLLQDPRPVVHESPDYPEPSAGLVETLGVLLTGIRAGRFFACPEKGSGCSPCRYPSVCGVGIEDRFALKRGDERIAPHLRLRGDAPDVEEEGS